MVKAWRLDGVIINIGPWDDLGGENPLPEGAEEVEISDEEVAAIQARAETPVVTLLMDQIEALSARLAAMGG